MGGRVFPKKAEWRLLRRFPDSQIKNNFVQWESRRGLAALPVPYRGPSIVERASVEYNDVYPTSSFELNPTKMSSTKINVFPSRMALTQIKLRLKGAERGHSLLKKKSDALTMRFRQVLKQIVKVIYLQIILRWFFVSVLLYHHY